MADIKLPQVGLGLFIVRGDEVLMGQRRGSHGEGEWGGPGGHLEYGESFEASLLREKNEEAGKQLVIKNLSMICVTNMLGYMPKHYVDIGFKADWVSGEPVVMEPEKLIQWQWFPVDDLPQPLFGNVANYAKACKAGEILHFNEDA